MAEVIRWGVLGARSKIYRTKLLPPMQARDGHQVVAEASRDTDGGDAPYAELLRNPEVDAVYIPLPNDSHKRWILAALEAGKHVLCEKPLTMCAADTDEVYAAAASVGRVLGEAYMWPHHPRSQVILDVARRDLGELRFSRAAFSFMLDRPHDHRFDARGGGALFDVGIYVLGPALLLAPREPRSLAATAARNDHGVDVSMIGFVDLGEGFGASFEVSFESVYRRSLHLTGTKGAITIESNLAPGPTEASTVPFMNLDDTVVEHPAAGADAYGEMLDAFALELGGATPRWGADESRLLARWIDALHASAS